MLTLMLVLGLIAALVMTACIYKKIDFGKLLVVGASSYIALYVIASGILIWMDRYTITAPTVIVLILEVIITAAMLFIDGFELPYITVNFPKHIPLLVILVVCGVISTMQQAGYYGTGQDEGLYQIRAMYYLGGNYDNVVDFSEYYDIENAYEKGHYQEEVADMVGYYLQKDNGVEDAKDMEGVFHGISTFPALLALWGKLFGLVHMPGILTVLYLLTIANTWYVGDNLKFRMSTRIIISVFLGICPIVLWSSQNTLTEIGLAMFISSFILAMTENQKKQLALLSVIPFIAACFFHVALSVLMPMIVVLYTVNYLYTKDSKYMAALGISTFGYAVGFTMMMSTAWYYTTSNLSMLFGMTKFVVNEKNILMVVWIASAVVMVFSVVFTLKPVSGALLRKWKSFRKTAKGQKTASIIMIVLTALTVLKLVIELVKTYNQNMWLMKTGIVCYLASTGYIMLPLAFVAIFVLGKSFAAKRNMFTIYFSFLYIMFMYCASVWVSIYFYYYYARYYVPFVMLVLVAAGYLVDQINWKAMVPVALICAGLVVWQSNLLYTERDLTYGDYQILDSMTSCIGEDDCILIYEQGYHIQRLFAFQLKGLTGVDIYYADKVRLYKQIEDYNALYDNVFVLTYDLGTWTDEEDEAWRYVYRGNMKSSIYDKFVDKGMPYAKEAIKVDSPVALMIWNDTAVYDN